LTNYIVVFNSFLSKIQKDSTFALYSDSELVEDLISIMNNAIPLFRYPRENLLLKNDSTEIFDEDLNLDTISVLTDFMKYEWYQRKTANSDSIDQRIVSKDLTFYSQANHTLSLQKNIEEAYLIAKRNEARYYTAYRGVPTITGLVGDEI